MYQYVLFDLDGTLTNPASGITNSIIYALKKFDIEVTDRTTLYSFIGPPLIHSFQSEYGFSKEKAEQALAYYREYFSVKGIYENEVYDGIPQLLKFLKEQKKTIILATSKPEAFAKRILEHFHLAPYFDFIAGATMDETRSEKADIIAYAIEQCQITDSSMAVMVGDRKYDILGAKQFGMASIGVLFGFGSRAELEEAGASYLTETPQEIMRLF